MLHLFCLNIILTKDSNIIPDTFSIKDNSSSNCNLIYDTKQLKKNRPN
jgi:hypothetical protein